MNSEIKKTIKFSGIYALGIFAGKAVSFIMLPIYTRFLTPEDYGTIELLTMTIDIFGMIAGIGLSAAVYRFYYKYESIKDRNSVISTIFILLIGAYGIGSAVGISFAESLSKLVLNGSHEEIFYFQLMFMTFLLQSLIEVPMLFIKAQQRPILFVGFSMFKLLLQLSLNIYFIVILNMTILGVLYSSLIASFIIGTLLSIHTFKTVGFHFSKPLSKKLILFGVPFIFSNIGDFILTFSDRYFLKAFTDLTTVGLYSLGYKFGFLLWLFPVRPIMDIWAPQRFEIVKREDFEKINAKVFFFLNLIVIGVALSISLFSFDLFRIMSAPEFWGASKIVPLIMLAYIIQSLTSFGNFGVMYSGQTRYVAYGTVAAAAIILILNFILIPKYSAYGAAVATIFAFLVRFFIIFGFSQKFYRLKLPWKKFFSLLLLAMFSYFISTQYHFESVIWSIGYNFICLMLFVIGILFMPFFDAKEKKMVFKILRNPLKTLKSGGISSA